jgi:hypothetical protein
MRWFFCLAEEFVILGVSFGSVCFRLKFAAT